MHVHSNEGDVIKMHQHRVTIVLMSYPLSTLYVDIKFDMFNPLDAKPFSLISAKGFLVKFVYREVMTLSV